MWKKNQGHYIVMLAFMAICGLYCAFWIRQHLDVKAFYNYQKEKKVKVN
jgi:hypothetical protein